MAMDTQHIGIHGAETDVTKQLNTYPNSVLVVAMTQEDSWQDPSVNRVSNSTSKVCYVMQCIQYLIFSQALQGTVYCKL